MRLADRLVVRAWMPRLGTVFLGAVAIFSAVELIDLANQGGGPSLLRYPLRVPAVLVLVAPVALLVSACWCGAHLRRTGQLVALSAAGRSPRRGAWIIIALGLLGGGVSWLTSSWIAPPALVAWAGERTAGAGREGRWVRAGPRTLIRAGGPDDPVVVVVLDEQGLPRRIVEAAGWRQRGARRLLLAPAAVHGDGAPPFGARGWALPSHVELESERPERLSGAALWSAAAAARARGGDDAPFEAEMGLRAALALACPICALLGFVAGVRFGRQPGVAAAAATGVGLLYWAVLSPLWALAGVGAVGAAAVALGPAAILGAVGAAAWWFGLR